MTLSATTARCFLTKVYSSSFVCHWRKPIDLCRHDEIVLVETLDLLGAQRHSPIAPAEANVGMATFRLRKLANLLNESERLPEVPETKGLFDPVRIIHERLACGRSSSASARVSGGMPPRHGVQVFSTSASVMPPSVNQHDHSRLRPAYPIKRRRVRQRTQASQGV